ncbi:MAG: hypothetical protein WCP35_02275 [Verrucomicrobiota bacterium]
MKIHLVTYATPRFRHRQILLGVSARLNHVVDTVTAWTPPQIIKAGFEDQCKGIKLTERGSGFWAWKPFVIQKMLAEVPDGDLVFYCDVGRRFPYKLLDRSLEPFLRWMDQNSQDFLPGLKISWRGPLTVWTKRDAFVIAGMDTPDVHAAFTVQGSFSLWRACAASRNFVGQWLDLCSDRRMISDDPSVCGRPEYPDFFEHRHDQALLTLCCLKYDARSLEMGDQNLPIDTRDPTQVLDFLFHLESFKTTFSARGFRAFTRILEYGEGWLRKYLRFGQTMTNHTFARD